MQNASSYIFDSSRNTPVLTFKLRTYSNLKSDIKPTINFQDTQSWETAGHASGQVLVYLQKKR